jgi:predicted PurR-regulated permease PerM
MTSGRPLIVRMGVVAWSFVGIVLAVGIVVAGLATVSSVLLPLVFAAVLAVLFRPVVTRLERVGLPSAVAAALVMVGLVLVLIGVAYLVQRGIVSQSDEIVDKVVAGLEDLDVDATTTEDVRAALEDVQPSVAFGFVKSIATGLSTVGAFLAGLILATLIMYYLLKDGPQLRATLLRRVQAELRDEADSLVTEACFVLRRYWWGRTIVSAIVAAVVAVGAAVLGLPLIFTLFIITFIGGYIPYLGAILGGAFAVAVALAVDGVPAALIMLAVVLAANLLVENLVEPAVTGRTLSIHPLVVLLVTTAGGILGGIVGLILAVPLTVIGVKVAARVPMLFDIDADEVRERLRRTVSFEASPDDEAEGIPAPMHAHDAADAVPTIEE